MLQIVWVDEVIPTWLDVSSDDFADDFFKGIEKLLLVFGIEREEIISVAVRGREDNREDG